MTTQETPNPVKRIESTYRVRFEYKNVAIQIYPKEPDRHPELVELCGPVEYTHHDSAPEDLPAPLRPLFFVILSWYADEIGDIKPGRATGTPAKNAKTPKDYQLYLKGF